MPPRKLSERQIAFRARQAEKGPYVPCQIHTATLASVSPAPNALM